MSGVIINDLPAHQAIFCVPRIGAWSISALVHSSSKITGAVSVVCDGITYRGTVVRGDIFNDTASILIAPGAAGLSKTAKPKHYRGTTARTVAQELLADAGEALDATADLSALARSVPAWTTIAQPIGTVLGVLMTRAALLPWRMLPNGKFWAGAEKWADAGLSEYQVLGRDDALGSMELGMLSPALLPGTMLEGRRVSYVETTITADAVRAHVFTEVA